MTSSDKKYPQKKIPQNCSRRDRDVDKGGGERCNHPPWGAIFALKYLKKEAKLDKNGQKWSIRPPPLEGKS